MHVNYTKQKKKKNSLKEGIILDKCLFRQSLVIIVPFQLSHYHWYGSPGQKNVTEKLQWNTSIRTPLR